jgi:hypothetical protein
MSGWTSFRNSVTNVAKKVAPVALGAAGAYFGKPLLGSLAGSMGGSLFGGGGGGGATDEYGQPTDAGGGDTTNWLGQAAGAAGRFLGGAASQPGYGGAGNSNMLSTLLGGGAQLYGQQQANKAITDAANISAQQADRALQFQKDSFATTQANNQPWLNAGREALGKLSPLMDYKKFSMDDFHADPGYNFRLAEGQRGLDASAAARGGLQSGAALKAAAAYGQDMGSQEYQNAFNRYGVARDRAINPLMQMAGLGQSGTNSANAAAQGFGNNASTIAMGQGDTQANANIARGSTYANTGNQLAQMLGRYGRA